MRKLLSSEALATALAGVAAWAHHPDRDSISRTYQFPSFAEAIRFVNAIAEVATEIDHHPDIDIRYNKVRLEVTTHSARGLTRLDFVLASRAEELADDLEMKEG